jgi:hypothetical protein
MRAQAHQQRRREHEDGVAGRRKAQHSSKEGPWLGLVLYDLPRMLRQRHGAFLIPVLDWCTRTCVDTYSAVSAVRMVGWAGMGIVHVDTTADDVLLTLSGLCGNFSASLLAVPAYALAGFA